MATSTRAAQDAQTSAITGLDSLELAQRQEGSRGARIARKTWRTAWPKLLAIVIVLAAWQLFYAVDFHGDSSNGLVKGPWTTLGNLGHQLVHEQLWGAIGNTLQTAVIGYGLALIIG